MSEKQQPHTSQQSKKRPRTGAAAHAFAGTCSGLIATSLLHPLDLVKIRFQVYEGGVGLKATSGSKYQSSVALGRSIVRQHGVRALYNGIAPALLGSGVAWGLYWMFYENAKARHQRSLGEGERLATMQHLASSCEAGVICVLITHPIWLLKTRLQLQTLTPAQAAGAASDLPLEQRPYRGMVDAVKRIVREEGYLAMYRGVVPALLLVSHGVAQFCVYEKLKTSALDARVGAEGGGSLGTLDFLTMGAVSKVIATTATYPSQVIKSRLQQRPPPSTSGERQPYKGTAASVLRIVRSEGTRGLYKGLGPNLLRVAPNAAITFTAYESLVKLF